MSELIEVTAAEAEALLYLTEGGRTRWYPSALSGLYRRRYVAERRRDGQDPMIGRGRKSAWNRTAGAVNGRLMRKGIVERYYLRAYRTERVELTDAGRELVADLRRKQLEHWLRDWSGDNVIGDVGAPGAADAVRKLLDGQGFRDLTVEPDPDDPTTLNVSYRPDVVIEVTIR